MRIGKKKLLLPVLLAAAGALAWYALQPAGTAAPPDSKRDTIIVVLKTNDILTEFWKTVGAGVKAAALEFDVKTDIRGPVSEAAADEQIRILEKAIEERPRAIVLAAADDEKLAPVTARIRKAGIPLVAIDSGMGSAQSLIAHDNVEAGRKAGDAIGAAIGGRGKVAVIGSARGSADADDREQGVLKALAAYPQLAHAGTFSSEGSEERAYEATRQLLETMPDLNGIVALNEAATLGAAKWLKERNMTDTVKLVGFDSSIYEIMLLEENAIRATIVQKPFNLGYLGVKTAVQLINGDRTPAKVSIDSIVITKANMYAPENQKLLFPFVE
ncbi:substrate-binding domain-containing protein [Paenibacillus sp. MBLB4367]|uniref:substrate-binding domain-containing protein n=1 Tax=Paenibacillus sp. MBLB4367 TaxID=3384767 RepID=UPI00390830CE